MPTGDIVKPSSQSPHRGYKSGKVIRESSATGHVTIQFTNNFGFSEVVTIPSSWISKYIPEN